MQRSWQHCYGLEMLSHIHQTNSISESCHHKILSRINYKGSNVIDMKAYSYFPITLPIFSFDRANPIIMLICCNRRRWKHRLDIFNGERVFLYTQKLVYLWYGSVKTLLSYRWQAIGSKVFSNAGLKNLFVHKEFKRDRFFYEGVEWVENNAIQAIDPTIA